MAMRPCLKQSAVVHLTSVHPANDNRIFYKMCASLAKAGGRVHLVAPGSRDYTEDGVDVVVIKPRTCRPLRMLLSVPEVFVKAIRLRGDIYHFHDPELLPIGLLLRVLGKKVVYDVHEDYVTSIQQKEYLPKRLRSMISILFDCLERLLSKAFNVVIAERYYQERFPRALYIGNYPLLSTDASVPRQSVSSNSAIETYKSGKVPNTDYINLLYTGNVTGDRGAFVLPPLLSRMPNLHLYYIGQCSPETAGRMRALAGNEHEWRLTLVGVGEYIDYRRIKEWYVKKKWTAGVAVFPPTEHYMRKELTKMFEYMAYGIPILCSHFPVWRALMEESGAGVCVDPLSTEDIIDRIHLLYEPGQHAKYAENCRLAASRYTWQKECEKLFRLYTSLLASKES